MIKIIVWQDRNKGYKKHPLIRTFNDVNEDREYQKAIAELRFLRGEKLGCQ